MNHHPNHPKHPFVNFVFNPAPKKHEPYLIASSVEKFNDLGTGPILTSYSMYHDIYKRHPRNCDVLLHTEHGTLKKKFTFFPITKKEIVLKEGKKVGEGRKDVFHPGDQSSKDESTKKELSKQNKPIGNTSNGVAYQKYKSPSSSPPNNNKSPSGLNASMQWRPPREGTSPTRFRLQSGETSPNSSQRHRSSPKSPRSPPSSKSTPSPQQSLSNSGRRFHVQSPIQKGNYPSSQNRKRIEFANDGKKWNMHHICEEANESTKYLLCLEDPRLLNILVSNSISEIRHLALNIAIPVISKGNYIFSQYSMKLAQSLSNCFQHFNEVNNVTLQNYSGTSLEGVGEERVAGHFILDLEHESLLFTQLPSKLTSICIETLLIHEAIVHHKTSPWKALSPPLEVIHDLQVCKSQLLGPKNLLPLKSNQAPFAYIETVSDTEEDDTLVPARIIVLIYKDLILGALMSLTPYGPTSCQVIDHRTKQCLSILHATLPKVQSVIRMEKSVKNLQTDRNLPDFILAVASKKESIMYLAQNMDVQSFVPVFREKLGNLVSIMEKHPKWKRYMIIENGVYYVAKRMEGRFAKEKEVISNDFLIFASLELNSRIETLLQMELF